MVWAERARPCFFFFSVNLKKDQLIGHTHTERAGKDRPAGPASKKRAARRARWHLFTLPQTMTWLDQFGGASYFYYISPFAFVLLPASPSSPLAAAPSSISFAMECKLSRPIAGSLIDNQGKSVPLDRLAGKIVGLYFSAQWCPPCRRFTPELASFYKTLVAQEKPFEVVFISADR